MSRETMTQPSNDSYQQSGPTAEERMLQQKKHNYAIGFNENAEQKEKFF